MRKKIKKNTSRYSLLTLLFLLLFLLPAPSTQPVKAAGESSIITTVSVTPLKITLSAKKTVFVEQKFNLNATVENLGQRSINNVILVLELPPQLSLEQGNLEQNLGTIAPQRKKIVNWQIRALQKGEHIIRVSATGLEEESNQAITSSASITIGVFEKNIFRFLYWRLLEFLNSLF